MLLAEAGCVFMGLILCISGVQGRANSICALEGSSVQLSCSGERPTSDMKWYNVHENGSTFVLKELPADGNRAKYNMSEQSDFTLTIKDLRENDAKSYCCTEKADQPEHCWQNRTELRVADLQVKVIPTTEGQTVTLMCSTSCPLTEKPAAYIWYKNREFVYQDWSPWYQQLVSSDEAVTYSCAVKGYEDLRAPEVSVDSVTLSCFNVTYAKGRMCSYVQRSEDEPCSITYPTELHVQKISEIGKLTTLACETSCPLTDPQTAYRWYIHRKLHRPCDSQHITLSSAFYQIYSCAVKGHDYLHSAETCFTGVSCHMVNYVTRRICALEGSSVNITSIYSDNNGWYSKLWSKVKRRNEEDVEVLSEVACHLEFHSNGMEQRVLRITNLTKNDSAEYMFRIQTDNRRPLYDSPGVLLVVTGLKVTMSPSAEVTEGQRVTLTCSTSCPLPDNTNYTWYLNGRPLTLPEYQRKHLVLDPVSCQHAGNYSCAVETPQNISSHEKTLTVMALERTVMIMNAVKVTLLLLIPHAGCVFCLMMRRKKTLTSTAERRDVVQPGQIDSIALVTVTPAAQSKPAEQQEATV